MKGEMNMKKLLAFILAALMIFSLIGCETNDPAASNDPAATTVPAADDTTAAADETTAPQQTEAQTAEEAFSFTFEDVELIPGQIFDASALPEPASLYQVPSCAIDGTDNVYNFGTIEVTAFHDGTREIIYSVYIIDANTPTAEGLYIGDTLDMVVSAYGEDYMKEGNQVTYQKGDTLLIVILDGDYVRSIDFRWVVE